MNLIYRTTLPLGGLVALLIISLGFNYFLIKRYRHFYRELSRVTMDPLGLAQFEAESGKEAKVGEGKLVLFYGDSRATTWPVPDKTESFVFVNRGVDGQTSAQVNLRYQTDAAPLQPDVVVLQVGINDLRIIPALEDDPKGIIAATETNIRQIVEQATASGAAVVLTTIFPVQVPPWQERMFWSVEVMTAVTAVNQYIQSLAGENVSVLDAYALLADSQGELRHDYAADYLHINPTGYRHLNDLLLTYLKPIS